MNNVEMAKTLLNHEGKIIDADRFPVATVIEARVEMSSYTNMQSNNFELQPSMTIQLEVRGDVDTLKKISDMRYCSIIPRD